MTFLNTLKFTAVVETKPSLLDRQRATLIANLKDQLIRLEDTLHTKSRMKWIKENGEKRLIEKLTPVRPWWKETLDGKVVLFVRSGLKKIEFEKGKTAIVLSSRDELPKVLNGLIEATQNGEMDRFLGAKPSSMPVLKRKVA